MNGEHVLFYMLLFVFPPFLIAHSNHQPAWALFLNLFISVFLAPFAVLYVIAGAAFGSLEGLGLAIVLLFTPFLMANLKREKSVLAGTVKMPLDNTVIKNYTPIEEFLKIHQLEEKDLIEAIQDGSIKGKLINDKWYVFIEN